MKNAVVLIAMFALLLSTSASASADQPDVTADRFAPTIHIHAKRSMMPQRHLPSKTPKPDDGPHLTKNKYGGYECLDLPDGTLQCFGNPGVPPPTTNEPAITPGDILTAVREIGLPSLTINIQPADATLVNFDTIFYAQPRPFARDIDLLGYNISLRATPVAYRWQHGDGSSHTTTKPGRPYPAKDVTYKYKEPAKHIRPSVDVTYAVRYRIDGGPWQSLRQTLQASGPAVDLEVKEAIPVLAAG